MKTGRKQRKNPNNSVSRVWLRELVAAQSFAGSNPAGVSRRMRIMRKFRVGDVEFFRTCNPYTTYQNLSMFIGGILTKETNPTVDISDKDMVIKKGLDKWSFRRMRGDKR